MSTVRTEERHTVRLLQEQCSRLDNVRTRNHGVRNIADDSTASNVVVRTARERDDGNRRRTKRAGETKRNMTGGEEGGCEWDEEERGEKSTTDGRAGENVHGTAARSGVADGASMGRGEGTEHAGFSRRGVARRRSHDTPRRPRKRGPEPADRAVLPGVCDRNERAASSTTWRAAAFTVQYAYAASQVRNCVV